MVANRSISARLTAILLLFTLFVAAPLVAVAHAPANEHFQRVWERTDQPVAASGEARSWIWGPEGFTAACTEPYHDAPGGERTIQHFDKSRMEINDADADVDPEWFVTQGLLAQELISGQMQVGDAAFIDWGPAQVHSAGDPDGGAPSYSHFGALLDTEPLPDGATITQTIDSEGNIGDDPVMADFGVTAAEFVEATNQRIASVFWEFMTGQGPVMVDGEEQIGPIFENPFYGVGLPITGAYWTRILVGGVEREVLIQAFERRVLTYTPDNPNGWQVEAGNVGQHYYIWRYGALPAQGTGCPDTLHVTFHVYELRDSGWQQIAVTTTREVWHPDGIATGIWRTYSGSEPVENALNSSGTLKAHHRYDYVFGGNYLVELDATVQEILGPSGGWARVYADNFRLGFDSRVPGSMFIGEGYISYDTGTETGTLEFDVAGTSNNVFHVLLDGSAPPVFFR